MKCSVVTEMKTKAMEKPDRQEEGSPLEPFSPVGARRTKPGGKPQKYFLDEPGRRLIRAQYDGTPQAVRNLALRLGASQHAIRDWACEMGVARRQVKPRDWTEAEIVYLEQAIRSVSLTAIARKLDRTPENVRWQAKKLGLRKTGEGYTARSLALGLGCDSHKVLKWVEKGWLRGTRRQTERNKRGDIWYFSEKQVRSFVFAHPQELDPRHFDWLWLVDVLAGDEGLGVLEKPKPEKE